MDLGDFVKRTGVRVSDRDVKAAQQQLSAVLDEARKASIPATPKALGRLYTYPVPRLSEDGTCSLHGELAPRPFDVGEVLGGRVMQNTLALMVCAGFLERMVQVTKLDWVGIYQIRDRRTGPTLVKLAARGAPSRAEFPLTPEFEARSTNVRVARSGKAVVIQDVVAHVKSGGAYYECDPAVRSEACVPLLSRSGAVVGLIDAEHRETNAFTEARLGWVVALALEMPAHLPLVG